MANASISTTRWDVGAHVEPTVFAEAGSFSRMEDNIRLVKRKASGRSASGSNPHGHF